MIDVAGAVFTIGTARRLGRSIRIDNGLLTEHAGVNAGFAIATDIDERPDLRPDRRIDLATAEAIASTRIDAVVNMGNILYDAGRLPEVIETRDAQHTQEVMDALRDRGYPPRVV